MAIRSESAWRAELVKGIAAELEKNLPIILADNANNREGFNVTIHFPPMAKSAKVVYPPMTRQIRPEPEYE